MRRVAIAAALLVAWLVLLAESDIGSIQAMPANDGPGTASVSRLAIDPTNPRTLYASGSTFVDKSTDGGASWQAASNGLPSGVGPRVVIDPTNSRNLFAPLGKVV